MASISAWLVAFRLRTLPLALSTIILGSFLAVYHQAFRWSVFIGAVFTTLFLQILSNLANDYGDTVHGVDNAGRIGPQRGLQAGLISLKAMRNAIILFVILSLISGIFLIVEALKGLEWNYLIYFFLLGVAAIIAALKYTMGKNPYGYAGRGDIFVFIFFGLVGVMGSYFLYTHHLSLLECLPALSIGFFSTGVLNLNNMRDRENDALHGKHTIVVKMGLEKAKKYHTFLIISGMLTAVIYSFSVPVGPIKWIYLISFIMMWKRLMIIRKNTQASDLDPELKYLALSTLLFSLLFGVGLVIL